RIDDAMTACRQAIDLAERAGDDLLTIQGRILDVELKFYAGEDCAQALLALPPLAGFPPDVEARYHRIAATCLLADGKSALGNQCVARADRLFRGLGDEFALLETQ